MNLRLLCVSPSLTTYHVSTQPLHRTHHLPGVLNWWWINEAHPLQVADQRNCNVQRCPLHTTYFLFHESLHLDGLCRTTATRCVQTTSLPTPLPLRLKRGATTATTSPTFLLQGDGWETHGLRRGVWGVCACKKERINGLQTYTVHFSQLESWLIPVDQVCRSHINPLRAPA